MNTAPPKWLNRGYLALFALLPWSVEMPFGKWALVLPAEPLLALLGLVLAFTVGQKREEAFPVFWKNRLFCLSALWIGWQALAAAFSSMPLVSWKYCLVEAGQWWVFAGGLALWPELWKKGLPVFGLSLAGVVIYTIVHHAGYGFRADQALLSPMPFFPDHTLYASVLAAVSLMLSIDFTVGNKWRLKTPFLLLAGIALALTHSRAALCSLLVAVLIGTGFIFWAKYARWIMLAGLALLATGLFYQGKISEKADTYLHRDVSSAERLNRYACAARMAAERPGLGFGPGTFQFQYLAYQRPEEMTRISITAPLAERSPHTYGRGGGAHSEYWQALVETGWPGLALWLAWAIGACILGARRFFQEKNQVEQWATLALLLGLLTFLLHGLVNNLLHDSRMAFLVWSATALLGSRRYTYNATSEGE